MKLPSSQTYAFWLAILRIFTGFAWLTHGVIKFVQSASYMPPNGFIEVFIQKGIAASVGPYHDFLANVVQPNLALFAELVRLGEVLTGCVLVVGLLTRLGGAVGVFLCLNYMAAKGMLGSADGWSGLDGVMLALSATNVVLPTGRFLGVDALLGRHAVVAAKPVRVSATAVPAEFVDEQPLVGPTAPKE